MNWKKWLAVFCTTLLVLVSIAALSSQKANATPLAEASVSAVAKVDAPTIAKVTPEQRNIGGSVVKPFYYWLPPEYCYWRSGITSSSYYCYRYGCTYFERVAWGCYDGYVRMTTYTWI